jgi:hypothetical protein
MIEKTGVKDDCEKASICSSPWAGIGWSCHEHDRETLYTFGRFPSPPTLGPRGYEAAVPARDKDDR